MKKLDRNEFSKLEVSLIDWFKKNSSDANLLKQLDSLRYSNTEYSGAGFFVNFNVDKSLLPITDISTLATFPLCGPYITSESIDNLAGSLLWESEGYLYMIEIDSYGDFINENITDFQIVGL
jgi:hypothetical protein